MHVYVWKMAGILGIHHSVCLCRNVGYDAHIFIESGGYTGVIKMILVVCIFMES